MTANKWKYLQFPCLACAYSCDNAPKILNHYRSRHSFDLSAYAKGESTQVDQGSQFGCPLCIFCVQDPDMLIGHYEDVHELYVFIDGETIKVDTELANEKRGEKQTYIVEIEKDNVTDQQGLDTGNIQKQEVKDENKEEGSKTPCKEKSCDRSKEPTSSVEQKYSPVMLKLIELMELVKKYDDYTSAK